MPTIKGNLLFVSSRAAHVSEVWVRAPRVRTHVEDVVTTGNDRFPVKGGEVSFTAVPGAGSIGPYFAGPCGRHHPHPRRRR